MNVSIDCLAELTYSGHDPQFFAGEDSEDPEDLRNEIEYFEIEDDDPESLEICKKNIKSLLRRCEEAGMTECDYETLWPVLDRLGIRY